MKLFRITAALLLVLMLLVLCCPRASAASAESSPDEQLEEIKDNINERLSENTGDDVREVLGDFEIDIDGDSLSEITIGSVVSKLAELFFNCLGMPSGMLGRLLASAVLCALAQSLSPERTDLNSVYRLLGTLAAVLSVYDCTEKCISAALSCLDELTVFMLSYIPIFASVTTASGNATAGAGFYGANLFLCECISVAAGKLLPPLLGILAAFTVTGAINPDIRLGNAAAAVKKVISWALGILMTVFTGVLTIQNAVGASADSARSKALRFAASSFIPIIGGSVSETYSALKGSFSVIKAGTGSVGVIIIAAIVLRPILMLLAARVVLGLGKLFCEMLGQEEMAGLASGMGSVLAIAMSITAAVSVMFIISTCIIMMTAANTGV